ncbi:MAG: iron permease, partial [Betaproteobacteria bacterium]|nr:iron permease [Betaproteobacteria bacterium]
TAEQKCVNCQLYQSKSADSGSCAVFPGKLVAAAAWCNAYQKKA